MPPPPPPKLLDKKLRVSRTRATPITSAFFLPRGSWKMKSASGGEEQEWLQLEEERRYKRSEGGKQNEVVVVGLRARAAKNWKEKEQEKNCSKMGNREYDATQLS